MKYSNNIFALLLLIFAVAFKSTNSSDEYSHQVSIQTPEFRNYVIDLRRGKGGKKKRNYKGNQPDKGYAGKSRGKPVTRGGGGGGGGGAAGKPKPPPRNNKVAPCSPAPPPPPPTLGQRVKKAGRNIINTFKACG